MDKKEREKKKERAKERRIIMDDFQKSLNAQKSRWKTIQRKMASYKKADRKINKKRPPWADAW